MASKKKDLEFLKEMRELTTSLINDRYDITKVEYLHTMITDWMIELQGALAKPVNDASALPIHSVSNLAKFCHEISKQEDCPAEFVEIVNREFWNLI